MKKLITSITNRLRQDWFSGLRNIYIAAQQIMQMPRDTIARERGQVRKGYWTMWWLLGRDANAMRYNRAGAGASVDNGEKEKSAP
jgi:hypothetical protein